jgi:hypothetical protein
MRYHRTRFTCNLGQDWSSEDYADVDLDSDSSPAYAYGRQNTTAIMTQQRLRRHRLNPRSV